MSKRRKGNYDTGEPRFVYFKSPKHMPHRHPRTGKLRMRLWIAKMNATDIQLDKKYGL